ncbi:MAG: (2Fe-2S)-binding protein [Bacillota bacterium]|nr:(2Fe-2S)-binding protein [Bacillota bacterium]
MSYPSEERMAKGPVAIAECNQEIPCNPCEAACKFHAIKIGEPITNLPTMDYEKCTGCGLCIAQCSGLAIFVINKAYGEGKGTVSFPYEYMPLPEKGQKAKAVDRQGKVVCDGEIVDVKNPKSFDRTPVVTVAVPVEYTEEVRSIQRRPETAATSGKEAVQRFDDDMLVCRCEEVTVSEIKQAIKDGARDVTGVKRRTRAGMGLCQGRTCEKMVQAILKQELGESPEEISSSTPRPPVRPITFGSLAGGEEDE